MDKTSLKTTKESAYETAIFNEELLELPWDILIPAAMEDQLTSANAGRMQAALVVEGANGPTTPAAEAILAERGITLVPDILANAGGVAAAYFEWVQNWQYLFWDVDEVDHRLEQIMVRSFVEVASVARQQSCTMRDAAMVLAVGRVVDAIKLRGIYP